MHDTVIHWFRQDLRLEDNPALAAAIASGAPVIPVFILDDETPGPWAPGGASRWWLHHSLAALDAGLRVSGSRLILRRGAAASALARLAAETGASTITFTRTYEPHNAALESEIGKALGEDGIKLRRFGGNLLFEPEAVRTGAGGPFKVFTPFYKACLAGPPPKAPVPAPGTIPAPAAFPISDRLEDWELLPTHPDWAGGLREAWAPGEAGAARRLDRFLDEAVVRYGPDRDRPDRAGTSRLSPHLHFGEIGPRSVWHRVSLFAEAEAAAAPGAQAFLRELVWREFSHHLLHHWPAFPEAPFRPDFARFPWRDDPEGLLAWQRGRTGYPIVDAGMRELWRTGWMHNRVRMIAASFLVKDLLVPWQDGETWFWDTLVDADLANNAASWQWVAGCGADAAPYFRIFNPVLQGEKFDPDGTYVKRWIPELEGLSAKFVHRPWEAPPDTLVAAGVTLGGTYPAPIVDHGMARRRALDALAILKE